MDFVSVPPHFLLSNKIAECYSDLWRNSPQTAGLLDVTDVFVVWEYQETQCFSLEFQPWLPLLLIVVRLHETVSSKDWVCLICLLCFLLFWLGSVCQCLHVMILSSISVRYKNWTMRNSERRRIWKILKSAHEKKMVMTWGSWIPKVRKSILRRIWETIATKRKKES